MSNLTYLYQALANARAVVTDIERAIENEKNSIWKEPRTSGYTNSDTNGNYTPTREAFYTEAERDAIDP